MSDFFEFYTVKPTKREYLRVRYGSGQVTQKGGNANWEDVVRPLRRPLTVYRGSKEALRIVIPAIFDGFTDERSVEDEVRTLEVMAGIGVPGDPEPPLLILDGYGALQHDYRHAPQNRWVIDDIEWQEALRIKGERVRQKCNITFKLHTVDERLSRAQKPKPTRHTTARGGDTYRKIAERELHHSRWGARLAQLNGARDGNAKLHAGQEVTLPTTEQVKEWERQPRR